MKNLSQHPNDYLKLRRQLGYKLQEAELLLRNFVGFADQEGVGVITAKLTLSETKLNRSFVVPSRALLTAGAQEFLRDEQTRNQISPPILLLSSRQIVRRLSPVFARCSAAIVDVKSTVRALTK